MSLVAFDTCDCCGGSGARRMAGSSLFFCEDCNDEFSFEEDDSDCGPSPELKQVLADALTNAERIGKNSPARNPIEQKLNPSNGDEQP